MSKLLLSKHYQNLLVLILVALLGVFAVTGYNAINSIVSEQSRIQQEAISPVYSLVNKELLKPLHIAETFSETITFEQILDTDDIDQSQIISRLRNMQKRLDLIFFVALEKQRIQLMSDGRSFDLIEGEVYWYFEALQNPNKIIPDLGQVGDVHLFFDVRIFNDKGEFLGFVGVGKRIKSFLDTFAEYKAAHGYDFLFVNENDQVILTSIPDLVVTDEFIPDLASLSWVQDQNLDIYALNNEVVAINEKDYLINEMSIDQLNWRLMLLVPMEQRQEQLTRAFIVNAIVVSAIIIVILSVIFFVFVSYKRKLEADLQVDSLTGLYNRAFAQRAYQKHSRNNLSICVAMMDLDHFKSINDTYGHAAGDAVLQEAARVLKSVFRVNDTVCRWGGEEFVLLIPSLPIENSKELIERAREKIEEVSVEYNGKVIQFTASFGVANGSATSQLSALLNKADEALYLSKNTGRNKVTLSSD